METLASDTRKSQVTIALALLIAIILVPFFFIYVYPVIRGYGAPMESTRNLFAIAPDTSDIASALAPNPGIGGQLAKK